MELNQLRYFQVVARHEHMTRAAEELCISQSSLSKTMATLEHDVGVKLFDRLGNRLALNAAGRAFLSRVDLILLELDDAVKEANASDRGSVHFAANSSGLCTNYIDQFLQARPKVCLQQSLMDAEHMAAAMESGELDCGLSFVNLSSDRLNWEQLIREDTLVLLCKTNPLAARREASLRDFAGQRFVCVNSGFGSRDLLISHCAAVGFAPDILFDGNEEALAFKLVAGDLGVMEISETVYRWMQASIENPAMDFITDVRITDPGSVRTLGLATRKNHYVTAPAAAFIQGLKRYFADLPYTHNEF